MLKNIILYLQIKIIVYINKKIQIVINLETTIGSIITIEVY